MSREKRSPLFPTSHRYHRVFDDRERIKSELEEFQELTPYLEAAREIHDEAVSDVRDTPEGQSEAMDRAINMAKDRYREQELTAYAHEKHVELEDAEKARIKAEVIDKEGDRIQQEVVEEMARDENYRRQQIAHQVEAELRQLNRDELFERLKSDEGQRTLERFGAIAVQKAQTEALVKELQAAAKVTGGITLESLPVDAAITLGLHATRGSYSQFPINQCGRVLKLRVLEPTEGVLETLDDSWTQSTNSVFRELALQDGTLLTMPRGPHEHTNTHISRQVEPVFHDEADNPINMYHLEVQTLLFADEVIF